MHSYALQVQHLDRTIAHLAARGVTVGVGPADGLCFTDPGTTGGLLFEWADFTVEQDQRLGAPIPPSAHSSPPRRPNGCLRWRSPARADGMG